MLRRQRRILGVVVVAVVVLLVGGLVGYRAWHSGRAPEAPAAQPSFGPVQLTDGQPIRLGRASAPVTVTLFEDFDCPHCGDFEETLGPTITELQRAGTVKVELYPMSFIDDGSVAAANAMACAAIEGFGQGYYAGLFANQGLQWSDQQLIQLGGLVGRPSADFAGCIRSRQHAAWVDSITRAADRQKVEETPTVLINGARKTDAAGWSPQQFRAAVQAAR
jgi:protein-disulfide isomerase